MGFSARSYPAVSMPDMTELTEMLPVELFSGLSPARNIAVRASMIKSKAIVSILSISYSSLRARMGELLDILIPGTIPASSEARIAIITA